MFDVLKFIKDSRIRLPAEFIDRLPAEFIDRPQAFIDREPSTWTLQEIFQQGTRLYVYVMENVEKFRSYYDRYKQSIKIVTDLLDARIFEARINIKSLVTALTPLAIAKGAGGISQVDPEQQGVISNAIRKLIYLGGIPEYLKGALREGGWGGVIRDAEAEVAGGAAAAPPVGMGGGARKKSSKKRTKKKSKKKTSKRKKDGKRKKSGKRMSSKRKKTKRKSMKQAKEKLIKLINSL
jgi:hypothetical protein